MKISLCDYIRSGSIKLDYSDRNKISGGRGYLQRGMREHFGGDNCFISCLGGYTGVHLSKVVKLYTQGGCILLYINYSLRLI